MTIREYRQVYKPFDYPQFVEYWKDFQLSHWFADGKAPITEGGDISDWRNNRVTEREKEIVGGVLKIFTLIEMPIGEYWSVKVCEWFPKHEIQCVARWLGGNETVHVDAYNKINEALNIDNFEAFLQDENALNKLQYLMEINESSPEDLEYHIARSLAVFSAFAEGVGLFSSFAILLFFSLSGVLMEVGKIVEYSCLDENKHSEIGIELFNIYLKEYPHLRTPELEKDINEAAKAIVDLEHSFIESVFANGEITKRGINGESLTRYDLKEYIKYRANKKLEELGYSPTFSVDEAAAERIYSWFDPLSSGVHKQDFFAAHEHNYGVVQCSEESFF